MDGFSMNADPTATTPPLVTFKDLSKSFDGVAVLKKVNLSILPGEILGLVGENGAGKSTLMKILTGLYPPGSFAGEFLWEGKPSPVKNLPTARSHGIHMVFQELAQIPGLSVLENLYLGDEISNRWGVVLEKEETAGAIKILAQLGLVRDPASQLLQTPLAQLGMGQRQMLEFGKALRKKPRLLILDEPTAALSLEEARLLLSTLRHLKNDGVSMVYISHRLHEIMEITDRICVLRDGQVVLTEPTTTLSEDKLIAAMVGRQLTQRYPPSLPPQYGKKPEPLLRVENIHLFAGTKKPEEGISGISFFLNQGEILGVAGLMGAGRTELALSLFGLYRLPSDRLRRAQIFIDGKQVIIDSPAKAMGHHIALVPEDRKRNGLILEHSVADNMALAHLDEFSRWGVIDPLKLEHQVTALMKDLKVRPMNPHLKAKNLSGGNQQKICLGKWLIHRPRILILDEPTRGVDVGAKYDIYQRMRELAAEGVGILMISSDMEEILGMSDRVMVLSRGRLTGTLEKNQLKSEQIMSLAVHRKEASSSLRASKIR